jgi:hypothetical protein
MPGPRQKRLFDCLPFFNEIELLKLRLHELYDHVDYFVICESTVTFSGNAKPLWFSENREMFRPFLDKIRLVVVDDMPGGPERWAREFHQRSAIRRALVDLANDDVVIVSDVDEIIRPSALEYVRANEGYFLFDMAMYQFHMNMRTVANGWIKAFAYTWALDGEVGDYNRIRQRELASFDRFAGRNHRMENGGWHFTFLGGADRVREKLNAYSHTEQWQQQMLRPGEAERQMFILRDVGGGKQLEFCEVDETFPQYLRDNLRHFLEIDFVKGAEARIKDLVSEFVGANRLRQLAEDKERYRSAELDRARELYPIGENIALNKPANQSSVSSRWSHQKTCEEEARGGNDGAIRAPGGYGFHTDREVDPWWQVDLVDEFLVDEVRLYNRKDGVANRLRHFSLLTSNDGGSWRSVFQKSDDAVFDQAPYVIHLNPAERARFVRIRLDGDDVLHFDQCLIYGRRPETEENILEDKARVFRQGQTVPQGRNGDVIGLGGCDVFATTTRGAASSARSPS